MRLSPRIYIPITAAVVSAVIIGLVFLWQIQTSVSVIEGGFLQPGEKKSTFAGLFGQTIRPDDTIPQSDALLAMREGEIAELKADLKAAEQLYQQSINAGGGIAALKKLASVQLKRRSYEDAAHTIQKLRSEEPDNPDVLLLEGLLKLKSGEAGSARRIFERKASSPQGQYGLGLTWLSEGDHDQATLHFTQAVQNTDATIRAYAQTMLDAYEEYALFQGTNDVHLQALLARALAEVNECELALPLANQAVNRQDKYRDAWIVKGFCELATERPQEALASLERAYSLDPEKPEVQYFLARTHDALGDTGNAITFLQYAIINGFSPEKDARYLLAEYALKAGNTPLALEQHLALTQKEDALLQDYENYVRVALTSPDYLNDAYEVAKNAKAKWPEDSLALTLFAEAAIATGKSNEAEQALRSALAIDPNFKQAQDLLNKLSGVVVQGS